MRPLVSIIIPTYNNATVVRDAIDSALAQSYQRKEIIIVDDGSTDDTRKALSSYTTRVNVIYQSNSGPGAARNRAVAASRGELLAFLDADDLWLPGKLEAQVEFLSKHPDIGVAYHDWHVVDIDSPASAEFVRCAHQIQSNLSPPSSASDVRWLYNELLFESVLCTDTVMMRRSLFDQLGKFDASLPQGQDYDLWLKASRRTQIGRLKEKFAVVRIRNRSISTTPRRENIRALVLQRALAKWGRTGPDGRVTPKRAIRKVLGSIWMGFGYGHLTSGDSGIAKDAFLRAARLTPGNFRVWLNLMRALLRQ